MSIRFALLCIIFHSAVGLCIDHPDESAMDPLVNDLKSEKSEVRETAAVALRKIAATNQKAVEQAGEYWKSKVALIKTGMAKAEVHKILPPCPSQPQIGSKGSGQTHNEYYWLDCHWEVTVAYVNPDLVHPSPPVLSKRELNVWVAPPAKFTGKWTCWYANGERAFDIDYNDGKYDGLYICYHDNGQKCFEQQYGQTIGYDRGWHENGKKSYEGVYKDGKQDGTWTHWYADGSKQSEKTFKNGVADGPDLSWYEDGQPKNEFHYENGKRVGREASWDEKGKLQFERQHDSDK